MLKKLTLLTATLLMAACTATVPMESAEKSNIAK